MASASLKPATFSNAAAVCDQSMTRQASQQPARRSVSRVRRSRACTHKLFKASVGRAAVTAAAAAAAPDVEETDVVIIGGGLAGLGAALALQKAGAILCRMFSG